MRPIRRPMTVITALITALLFPATLSCTGPSPAPQRPAAPAPPPGAPPVYGVKVDNTVPGRPPVGIDQADIVYIEPVEGGLSRILAVFGSKRPATVGPVRSARETDLQLLPQYGRPTLAYSGAAPELNDRIRSTPIQDAPEGLLPGAYYRDDSRKIPYNLFVRLDKLPRGAPWPEQARPHFGPAPAGGTPSQHEQITFLAASIGFDWSPQEKRWLSSMDGQPFQSAEGARLGAPTVVIQHVQTTQSAITDTAGSASPFAHTVGQGKATVLRDGQSFEATWSRPAPEAPTRYTTPGGEEIPFAPGPVWIVLTE